MPLRLRLTLWYTFSLGIILLLFAAFLYLQVRRSLIAQVDAALYLAANQALIGVGEVNGKPAFQAAAQNPGSVARLSDDFVIYLLAADGTVLDILSHENDIPDFSGQPAIPAPFETRLAEGEPWRVYRQGYEIGGVSGWIQVAQELDPVTTALAGLRTQIGWGLPLALLLAGLGGYFLAARALRPIDDITRAAQAISAGELNRRIHYQGPADEVGRLAATFNTMLDRLQSAFERERRFTADAAHELRTPLAALKGRIGVTLSKPRAPQTYVDALQEMEGEVDRMIRLSSDLLLMARLDRGQVARQLEEIDAGDLLGAVVDQIRPLAATKAITLEEDLPGGLTLSGDMDLLIRLFLNLLDNALKYTLENGRVVIAAGGDAESIQIMISDSGPGIPAEHLPHLFERFYRVEDDRARLSSVTSNQLPVTSDQLPVTSDLRPQRSALPVTSQQPPDTEHWTLDTEHVRLAAGRRSLNTEYRPGGAGLGLAIAYEIARAHGGTLDVQSAPGEGTTAVVQLPRNKPLSPLGD